MLRHHVTKSSLAVALLLTMSRSAGAEERCVLRGEPVMPEAVGVYDAPSEGKEIGHFTGAKVALTVTSFAESSGGRDLIETSGFRIKGFVRASDIPAYTTRAVPVHAGHLSIGEGRRVTVVGSSPGRLRVERAAVSPIAGVFQGWAPCDAVALSPKVPPGWAPPGGARGYLAKRPKLDIFEQPQGDLVASLTKAVDGPGILFWGGDTKDGFVHVEHHGDIVIDAWAKTRDLTALPPGETMDQVAPGTTQPGVSKIQLQGRAKVVRTSSPISLRAAATDAAVPIGGVDAGVDVIVVDVVAGWASVVPAALTIAPSGAVQFWTHGRDLGV
jgi:hypothetical protein